MKSISEMNLLEIFTIIFNKKNKISCSKFKNIDLTSLYKRAYEFYCINNEENIYDEEKIYNWMIEKLSYEFLTLLIDVKLDYLLEKDKFMFYNLPAIINIMHEFLNTCSIDKINIINTQTISKEKTNSLVNEILKQIDPSLEWLKIYEECRKNNKIIYINEYNEDQLKELAHKLYLSKIPREDSCICLPNNTHYIILNYKNKLYDTISTIHEFIHYIIETQSIKKPLLLTEFFSIFYEMYSLYFLKKQGFDLKELTSIYQNFRIRNLYMISLEIEPLFKYIKTFVEKKYVAFEDDFNYYVDLLKKLNIKNEDNLSPEKLAYKRCEKYIVSLLNNDFFETYPYVIGSYLSFEAMSNFDEKILEKIKEYLDSDNIDPYDVFKFVGCDVEKLEIKRVGEEEKTFQKEKRH